MSQELAVIEEPTPCDLARVDYTPEFLEKVETVTNDLMDDSMSLPKELQGKRGNVKVLVYKAFALGIDPVVMLTECMVINGKVGYGAQLIDAAIQSNGLGTPVYEEIGDWSKVNGRRAWRPEDEEGLGVKVIFTMKDGTIRDWTCWLTGCTTRNSPNWKSKPNLQLRYQAIKEWARLYAPGVMLGMYTPDELATLSPIDVDTIKPAEPGQTRAEELKNILGVDKKEEPPIDVTPEKVEEPPKTPSKPKKVTQSALGKALAKSGVPDPLAIDYLVSLGRIAQDQTVNDAPEETKRKIVDNPKAFKKAVDDFLAVQ